MSLRIIHSATADFISTSLMDELKQCRLEHRHPICLVPSFEDTDELKVALAKAGCGLGVDVHAIGSYLEDMWRIWGDSRRFVGSVERHIYMEEALDYAQLEVSSGAIRFACSVARQTLGYFLTDPLNSDEQDALERGYKRLYEALEMYARNLEEEGAIEPSYAEVILPALMQEKGAKIPELYVVGFSHIDLEHLAFLAAWSELAPVHVVFADQKSPAFDLERESRSQLIEVLNRRGLTFDEVAWETEDPIEANAEILELAESIYTSQDKPLVSRGNVDLVMPAGLRAEPEAIAAKVDELVRQGFSTVYVVARHTNALFCEIHEKLAARSISVEGMLSEKMTNVSVYHTFSVYLKTIAKLIEMGPTHTEETDDGTIKKLRDMSWWPPRQITDFMLSSLSDVDSERAWELDAQWRSNRLLTAEDVLTTLKSAKKSSQIIADSIRDLENGKIPTAIRRISERFVAEYEGCEEEPWFKETMAVLSAFLNTSMELSQRGVVARGYKHKGGRRLSEVVDTLCLLVRNRPVSYGIRMQVEGERGTVVVVSPQNAARMRPASIDALIYVGLENDRSAISITSTSRNVITSLLTHTQISDPLMQARSEFAKIIRATKHHLTLERVAYMDKTEAFNAVVLGELLEAYGHTSPKQPLPLPCMENVETCVLDNISPVGKDEAGIESVQLKPTGTIDELNRDLILLSPNAKSGEVVPLPLLSASQIDGYLDCPYKWFSQRRLRLSDTDAGFSPMEKGTFIHRVLELTFQKQLAELLDIPVDNLTEYFDKHDICQPIENSFITADNLAQFEELARSEFQSHYDHQFLLSNKKAQQPLIPHNLQERLELRNLLGNVLSFIEWHEGKLRGYEPRLFEYRFGDRRHKDIEYAGVRFTGSIDRVDVDRNGNAIIIDYKHKKFKPRDTYSLYQEFDAEDFVLPRHVQTLIYAQVLRRARPDITPVASLYLSPMTNEVSGAFGSEGVFARVMGQDADPAQYQNHIANSYQKMTFFDMLDVTEELIGKEIERMKRGDIPAKPKDKDACKWCPVAFCEKRIND